MSKGLEKLSKGELTKLAVKGWAILIISFLLGASTMLIILLII